MLAISFLGVASWQIPGGGAGPACKPAFPWRPEWLRAHPGPLLWPPGAHTRRVTLPCPALPQSPLELLRPARPKPSYPGAPGPSREPTGKAPRASAPAPALSLCRPCGSLHGPVCCGVPALLGVCMTHSHGLHLICCPPVLNDNKTYISKLPSPVHRTWTLSQPVFCLNSG